MTDKHGTETGDRCIFEALEARLLLSAWPVIGETGIHSTIETAQDVTAEMTELFAGEGSYGVVIEGNTDGESDYYRLDATFSGLVQAFVEPAVPGQGGQLDAFLTGLSWNSVYANGSLFSAYLGGGNSSYLGVKRDSSTSVDYRITFTVTEARTLEFINPAYAPEKSVWESIVTLEAGDPGDVFIMPDGSGSFRTEFHPDAEVSTDLSTSYTNMPVGIDMIRFLPGPGFESETSGYVYVARSGTGDLGEPNNTPAEAIDITDQLRDTPPWQYPGKTIYIDTNKGDRTTDWFKITLDDSYVTRNGVLRDANESRLYGIVGPGTYYLSNYSNTLQLELQVPDDGGVSFVEVESGIWKATVPAHLPEQGVLSIPLPHDGNVMLDDEYGLSDADHNILGPYYHTDPGYAYVTSWDWDRDMSEPLDIYAYETTVEVGQSSTAGTATDLEFLSFDGSPDFLIGFAQADQTVGQRDYFRMTIPWKADLYLSARYSSQVGDIYDTTGARVNPGIVNAGVYYLAFKEPAYDRQWINAVKLRPYLEGGGSDMASAPDLDPYMVTTTNGRYLNVAVEDNWREWYSFNAQQFEKANTTYIRTVDNGTIRMDDVLVPADGRYYLRGSDLDYGLIIDSPRDVTASVASSLAADGAWASSFDFVPQDGHSEWNILQFTLDQPTAFLRENTEYVNYSKLYDSAGEYLSAGLLVPGTYYARVADWTPDIHLRSIGATFDIDSLLVEQAPGVWEAQTGGFTSAIGTLTISEGQKFKAAVSTQAPSFHGRGIQVLDAQGRIRSPEGDYYMLEPGVYTIFYQEYLDQTADYLSVTVEQAEEAIFVPMATGPGMVLMEREGGDWSGSSGDWQYFRAVGEGIIYSSGDVLLPATGRKSVYAPFDAGDFVWVRGSGRIVDHSPRADIAGTNDTQATAIDVSSRWLTEPEGAEIMFVRGQFDNTTDEDWYRIDMAAGECIFSAGGITASQSFTRYNAFDADGNEVGWRGVVVSEPTTYFFRVTSDAPPGDDGYGFYLHRVRNARKGGSSGSLTYFTPLDDLYVPGQNIEFVAIPGFFRITTLPTDLGYWYELFPVASILWKDDPSYSVPTPNPVSSSTYFNVDSHNGPARVVIHFHTTDEVESNETIELAQDMTPLLVQDGETLTANFTGAAAKYDVDWFKFQIDEYSTVSIEKNIPEFREGQYYRLPGTEIYDVNGIWIANTLDEHVPPGEFYVRVRPPQSSGQDSPAMYDLTVTISPGTPGADDGNDTKETATSLNHLLDGEFHTIEDVINRTSDVDWFVFEPEDAPYVVSAKRTTGHMALDVYYEYDGQLFLHTDANYSSSIYPPYVVDTVPLYLRASLISGLPADAGVIEIEQVATPPIVELVPSETDPNVSTFHSNEASLEGMLLLPAGSRLQSDHYGNFYTRYAQPLGMTGSSFWAHRDMYVYFNYSTGSPANARLDLTITRARKIEISDMVDLGAPGQGHYEFALDVSDPGNRYFYMDHPANSSSTFFTPSWLGLYPVPSPSKMGPEWPSLAHIFYLEILATEQWHKLEGELWLSDETEPNDDLVSAQRIDAMWRPWLTTGQQLDLAGSVAGDESDPADNFVFHLDAGEVVYLDPYRSSGGGVLSGAGLVDSGDGIYLAAESGDVYLTGLTSEHDSTDEYRIALYRGMGVPANTEFSDAYDITAEMSSGGVTVVTNAKYVTFLSEPGHLYATSMTASAYSETGEIINYDRSASPAMFSGDNRDQVVLDIGGSPYLALGDILDVTERLVDLDSLFVPDPGQNTRSLSVSLAPGDYITFTADPNEVLVWDTVSDTPRPNGVFEASTRIIGGDGGGPQHMAGGDLGPSSSLGGGGRIYGSVQGYGNLTLTMTLTQTEPTANNTAATAVDLTDQLEPCDPTSNHTGAGEHGYVVYEGILSSADPVDWISVDLQPDQYATVRIGSTVYGIHAWSLVSERPPISLISASQEGGIIAGNRYDNDPKFQFDSMSKIAHEAKTQRIKISRTHDTTIRYRIHVSVRDVVPVAVEDLGEGDYYGEMDTQVIERIVDEWDGQIFRVDVPADSIMTASGAKKLIDAHNKKISGFGVATTEPETVYMAIWPSYFWDSSNYEHGTLTVDIHPLWTIIPDVIPTIEYTLGDIEQLQGAFTAQQETWWQFDAAAGRIVTLGRPDGAALAEQTDLILIRSSGVARPWNVTPEEDPALFDDAQRHQTLQSGTYYVMATPSVLSDGLNYDWQLLVQVAGDIEPNDTRGTATNLNSLFDIDANDRATVSLTGTFEDTVDPDWYLATVDAGDFLYADVTWEGGYWSNLPLEIYGPDGLLIWSDSERGGVDRMIYAAQSGNYWIHTVGVGMAYSLQIVHGDTTPVDLVAGQQWTDPPTGYDLWMARLDLPAGTALNTNWRHTHDSAGHLINASVADWIGLPHGDSYYIACYDGPLDADVRFADANVAATGNHSAAGAESLDDLFAVPTGRLAAEAYVLGLYGQAGTRDYYKVSLSAGDALTGGAIGHLEWDSVQQRWVNTYLEMKITWDGQEMMFPRNTAFVADHAGDAVITVRSLMEWDEYRLGLVKMAPGEVGTHAGPELIGGTLARTEMDLAKGYGANADGPMTIYDADYNFVGRIENGTWYAPRDGRYHMFSDVAPVAADPQLRPRQVVYVNFAGGLVGQIPELFVDMGTLAPFDAGRFDLAAQQAQLQESIVTKLREMFAAFEIDFVLVRPESLPFSKLYYTDSTLGGQLALAMPDGVNADLFDDAYVFAGNILSGNHGLGGVMSLDVTERSEVLATALANVGAAEVARLLGALPVDDTGDLMALEQWNDLSTTMAFSTARKTVRGMAILQNVAYSIGQGLNAHTPGAQIELGDNDTPANATIINVNPSDDHGPTLIGGLTPTDTDFFSFELVGSKYITCSISSSLGAIHMRLLDADLNLVLDDVDRDGRVSGVLDAGLYYIQLTPEAWASQAPASAGPPQAPVPPESVDYTLSIVVPPAVAAVAARHVFYNNSSFDGNEAAANISDDNAIAPDKQALLPGGIASFANYTSYSRGINGIMVDIDGLSGTPTDADFGIRVNESGYSDTWSVGPMPAVSFRPGDGLGDSDRVTLIWADGAILNQWVEVTVLSDAGGGSLGLAGNDVFYFGNAVGDCDGDGQIGSSDYGALVSQFGRSGDGLAADFDGSGRVDLVDFAIMRASYGNTLAEPPILPGDADGSGVVDSGDYEILIGQFGLTGTGLVADFNGDQRVDLVDFAILRGNFGNTLPAPAPAPEAPPAAPVVTLQAAVEPIAGAATPMVPVVSQPLDGRDAKNANDDSIATTASAPAIDLLVESPLAAGYISGPQAISGGLPAITLYRVATTEYDLRPLDDDLAADGQGDDLLADILAESLLAVL